MDDDECCVMEEKSLLGCFHKDRKGDTSASIVREDDDATEYCNSESTSEIIGWLPDELRRRMTHSFEDIGQRQSYPVIDWLREIRLSCDIYDAGLPIVEDDNREDEIDEGQWYSSDESDYLGEIEEMFSLEQRDNGESTILSRASDRVIHDVECEKDSKVTQMKYSEARGNVMTQLRDVVSWEIDKNCASNERARSTSCHWYENDLTSVASLMKNSSYVCPYFRLDSMRAKRLTDLATNRVSVKLADLILCHDDNRTLDYCDRCSNKRFVNDVTNGQDYGLLRDESLKDIFSCIEDPPVISDNENIRFFDNSKQSFDSEDDGSSIEDIEPIFRWIEEFESSDSLNEIYNSAWLEQRLCDSFDSSDNDEKLASIRSNYDTTIDSTLLEKNLDIPANNVTMPVMHWIATFNNFNALEESGKTTNRTSIDKFNIFDGNNDSSAEKLMSELPDKCGKDDSFENFSNPHAGSGNIACSYVNEMIDKIEYISEYRRRKGSVSSDIVAWKEILFDEFLDDEETVDQWFSSNDSEGKIYFFEENSNESSWVLPPVNAGKSQTISTDEKSERFDADRSTSEKNETGNVRGGVQANQSIVGRELPTMRAAPAGGDWPHLCDGNNMLVLKEGIINRTKITENGKKLRKNWSTSYAVLTELFLLFFKDAKTFTMMKTGQSSMAKPDISVDLNGALVEPGDRASSRKNVYMIGTVLGLQVLVQSDNTGIATEWFQEIHGAIRKLPSGFKSQGKPLPITTDIRKTSGGKQPTEINHHEDTKKITKIARSRSMKMKRLDDSLEDLSGSAAERQTKIKAKLRRFFQRRPAVELLVKNGIYKDEPAFGSYLSDVCPAESPRVPLFVKTCIEVLESDEENMKTDGLYRASGNLSQIQKIRLQVDQYKLNVLAQEEDVHVLAGALKLFFRELKEPLIPSSFFKEAVNASMLKKSSAKIQCFREIVKALPSPNYDTLQYLLIHLLRVTSYQEFNRMHIPNLAIVFGPTLMWPAEESANMALDFMQQNLVIECLLSEYNKIFK